VITSSRAHDMNGTLFHRSWTREHEFTTWKERSIRVWRCLLNMYLSCGVPASFR